MTANSFDYSELIGTLAEAISKLSGGKQLIESSTSGEAPDYPYCQYTITSPFDPITWDIVDYEMFEVGVSLTWRGLSGHEVLNLANRTNKWFRSQEGLFFMKEKGIVVVDINNDGLRDTLISIEYERMAGLDIKFRVRDSYVQDVQKIENFSIGNEGGS